MSEILNCKNCGSPLPEPDWFYCKSCAEAWNEGFRAADEQAKRREKRQAPKCVVTLDVRWPVTRKTQARIAHAVELAMRAARGVTE